MAAAFTLLAAGLSPASAAPPEDSFVVISPTEGQAGTTVDFSGQNCPEDTTMGGEVTHIRVFLDHTPPQSEERAYVPIQSDGSFSGSFVFPASRMVNGEDVPFDLGPIRVIFDCSTYNYSAESMVAEFILRPTGTPPEPTPVPTTTGPPSPEPTATTPVTPTPGGFRPPASPPTGAVALDNAPQTEVISGGSLSLSEEGFAPNQAVTAVLYSTPVVLMTALADGTGKLNTTITIPANTVPGKHTLVLFGGSVVKAGTVMVKAVDVYASPGYHDVNGRRWHTTCEPYSQTTRCRTNIWSTTVSVVNGRFVKNNGWHFNNLTYLPKMKRAQWAMNPLGHAGTFTSAGRQWYTECDTASTGGNGCRSYIWTTAVKATKQTDGAWSYRLEQGWVFNNMVRFLHQR